MQSQELRRATQGSVEGGDLRGSVDFAAVGRLHGSAWNHNDLSCQLEVQIFEGESILAEATANVFRPDLAMAGVGDGRHGFEVELPAKAAFDKLRAVIKGTSVELPLGPFAKSSARPRILALDASAAEGIAALHKRVERVYSIVNALGNRVGEMGKTTGELAQRLDDVASRTDVTGLHNRVATLVQGGDDRMKALAEGITRVEGFLNIDLAKRIREEANLDIVAALVAEVRASRRWRRIVTAILLVLLIGGVALGAYALYGEWLLQRLPGLLR